MSAAQEHTVKLVAHHLKCSICLELFVEPVTLECGHSYCRSCIQTHLDRARRTCPNCRFQLPEQPQLRKSVTLSNILDLQEAGGRQMWNQVCTVTEPHRLTEEALLRRLEILREEIKKMETLLAELHPCEQEDSCPSEDIQMAESSSQSLDSMGGSQGAGSSSSSFLSEPEDPDSLSPVEQPEGMLLHPDCDPEEMGDVPQEDRGAEAVFDCAATSDPAEFVLLSFSPTLGHRRLAYVPERRKIHVSSSRSMMAQSCHFQTCQWMADQEFLAGRYYWDVDVSLCSGWAAGVAYPNLGPNQKLGRSSSSWCIERSSKRLSAWHDSAETPLKQDCPNIIRVLLDMDSGLLSFWSLTGRQEELYSVQAHFCGPVRPVFWLFGTQQTNALTFPVLK